jgi:hypothetical protein
MDQKPETIIDFLKITHTPVTLETNCIGNKKIHQKIQVRFKQNMRFGAVKAVSIKI